uniref:SUN domain-containing protein n=1 Tax=Caenorhabditis tropicalis TaxID=1561998 RepID=A0A1I7THQ0_9PELO
MTLQSDSLLKKETITVQESKGNERKWSETLKDRILGYSIEQCAAGFILFLLLTYSYAISSNIKDNNAIYQYFNRKSTNFRKQGTTKFKKKRAMNEAKPFFVPETVEKAVENREVLTAVPIYKINAASYVLGAEVDTTWSSNSSLYRFFGDESEQVLVDRLEPPARKAWCSEDKEPILTVNLAKFIKPTAISYQHFKWNHIVPDGAPKVFDVVACLDMYCQQTVLLVSNFEYKSNDRKQEQIYPISPFPNASLIGKVQFRFRKNHGNVKETCVSLVRVYGETDQLPKKEKPTMKKLESCTQLKDSFHMSPFFYQYFDSKDCKTVYSDNCCGICPECCEVCPISDPSVISTICIVLMGLLAIFILIRYIPDKERRS